MAGEDEAFERRVRRRVDEGDDTPSPAPAPLPVRFTTPDLADAAAELQRAREANKARAARFGLPYVEPSVMTAVPDRHSALRLMRLARADASEGTATGFDPTTDEEAAKRAARANRFGTKVVSYDGAAEAAAGLTEEEAKLRRVRREHARRFGVDDELDVLLASAALAALGSGGASAGILDPTSLPEQRPRSLHIRGYGYLPLSTRDIFAFFGPELRPVEVEWLNGISLNVHFADEGTASRALHLLTEPVPAVRSVEAVHSSWRVCLKPAVKRLTDKYAPAGTQTTLYMRYATTNDIAALAAPTTGARTHGTYSAGGEYSLDVMHGAFASAKDRALSGGGGRTVSYVATTSGSGSGGGGDGEDGGAGEGAGGEGGSGGGDGGDDGDVRMGNLSSSSAAARATGINPATVVKATAAAVASGAVNVTGAIIEHLRGAAQRLASDVPLPAGRPGARGGGKSSTAVVMEAAAAVGLVDEGTSRVRGRGSVKATRALAFALANATSAAAAPAVTSESSQVAGRKRQRRHMTRRDDGGDVEDEGLALDPELEHAAASTDVGRGIRAGVRGGAGVVDERFQDDDDYDDDAAAGGGGTAALRYAESAVAVDDLGEGLTDDDVEGGGDGGGGGDSARADVGAGGDGDGGDSGADDDDGILADGDGGLDADAANADDAAAFEAAVVASSSGQSADGSVAVLEYEGGEAAGAGALGADGASHAAAPRIAPA